MILIPNLRITKLIALVKFYLDAKCNHDHNCVGTTKDNIYLAHIIMCI